MLLSALEGGAVGEQIQTLRIDVVGGFMSDQMEEDIATRFTTLICAGGLPCLTQLEIISSNILFERYKGYSKGKAFSEALEVRQHAGLPPLTCFKGALALRTLVIGRMWACCPPEQMRHLEAFRTTRLVALNSYLQQHLSSFVALRSLRLWAVGGDGSEVPIASIIGAIDIGFAPKLEELQIIFNGAFELCLSDAIVSLGRVLGSTRSRRSRR